MSLLRRHHCPVLEKERQNGERTERPLLFFPSFFVLRLITVSVTVTKGNACGGSWVEIRE